MRLKRREDDIIMSKVNNTVDLPYPDIYIKNNKVYQKVDGQEIRVSDGMGISTIKTDIDSSKIESMIYYYECGIKKNVAWIEVII